MTKDDVKAAIAKVDGMLERCERVAKKSLRPIKADTSYPRRLMREPVADMRAAQPPVRLRRSSDYAPPVSWEPQQRYDEIRRRKRLGEHTGYKPLCGGGFGEDVDAAFEACSSAPV